MNSNRERPRIIDLNAVREKQGRLGERRYIGSDHQVIAVLPADNTRTLENISQMRDKARSTPGTEFTTRFATFGPSITSGESDEKPSRLLDKGRVLPAFIGDQPTQYTAIIVGPKNQLLILDPDK